MTRVAVFPIDAIGHLRSMLGALAPLARDKRFAAITGFGRAFAAPTYARLGLGFAATMAEPDAGDPDGDLRWKSFIRPQRDVARTLEAVRRFRPDVILYDPFSLYGRLAAAICGAPSAAFVTMHGYGVLSDDFVRANAWSREDLQEASAGYRRDYGVDLRAEGALPVLFPSRDMTLVHTLKALHIPVQASRQPLLHHLLRASAPETPIGRSVDWDSTVPRSEDVINPAEDQALLDRLDAAKAAGRRVALFSLGTVITDFRYGSPVGGAPSGSAFLHRMLAHAFEAARRDPQLLLVASVGKRYLAGPGLAAPANAIVRASVPQVEILRRHADVFITHHGANSEAEAMLSGVGMVSLPGAGDQIPNARTAGRNGVALALWDLDNPYEGCTADKLADAIRRVTSAPDFRKACARLTGRTGGAPAADGLADRLLSLAKIRHRAAQQAVTS